MPSERILRILLGCTAVLAVCGTAELLERRGSRLAWVFAVGASGLVFVAMSALAARAVHHAAEAQRLRGQLSRLSDFAQSTLEMNFHLEPGNQLVELLQRAFGFEAIALFDADLAEIYTAGQWNEDPHDAARNVYYFSTCHDDPAVGLSRRVLRIGMVPVGSLVVRGEAGALAMNAIASLVATTLDRYRCFANESQMETERRTEQLRAAVLDNLAHAYKTPLTAIRAASTGLAEIGRLSPAQQEMVLLIDEQAEQLAGLTTRLLTTSRLDAGEVVLHPEQVAVAPLVDELAASLSTQLTHGRIVVDMPDDGLTLRCDRELISMLLLQYLENACKYALIDQPITVSAAASDGEVVFSVHSFGPVISAADRERIFDRYFRSSSTAMRASGTGIGLSVARRAAQAHGGNVWVASSAPEGTTFYASIPAPRRKAPTP